MKTKEAIEQIEKYIKALEILKEPESKLYTALKEIVPLLQQGEAYKQMWEELKVMEEVRYIALMPSNTFNVLQQKYFPKEVKQDYPEGEE